MALRSEFFKLNSTDNYQNKHTMSKSTSSNTTSSSTNTTALRDWIREICCILLTGISRDAIDSTASFYGDWFNSQIPYNNYQYLVDTAIPSVVRPQIVQIADDEQNTSSVSASTSNHTTASTSNSAAAVKQEQQLDETESSAEVEVNSNESNANQSTKGINSHKRRPTISLISTDEFQAQQKRVRKEKDTSHMQTTVQATPKSAANSASVSIKAEIKTEDGTAAAAAASSIVTSSIIPVKTEQKYSIGASHANKNAIEIDDDNNDSRVMVVAKAQPSVAGEKGAKAILSEIDERLTTSKFTTLGLRDSITQIILTVALEPVDLTIDLSLGRRRDPLILQNSLMDIYGIATATRLSDDEPIKHLPPLERLDGHESASISAEKLTINLFSRFPDLAIRCNELGHRVWFSIFSLASIASTAFDTTRVVVTNQGEKLRSFKYNDIMEEALDDRAELLYAMCVVNIVGIGGERNQRQVKELFYNALFYAKEHADSLHYQAVAKNANSNCIEKLSKATAALQKTCERVMEFRTKVFVATQQFEQLTDTLDFTSERLRSFHATDPE